MKKKVFGFGVAILLIVIFVVGWLLYNNENRLTSSEKAWISNNTSTIQNINILNDTNIFGNLGNGVFYTFLSDFSDEYNIQFNTIAISKGDETSSLTLGVTNILNDEELSFYTDHYVVVSKTSEVNVELSSVGVLSSSLDYVTNYFNDSSITISGYNTFSELSSALASGTIKYMVIPRMEYIDEILENNYLIVSHLSDLKRYYYIGDDTNSTLFQILKKYFTSWRDNLEDEIYAEELSVFQDSLSISNSELSEIKSMNITYGYVNNLPYEVSGGGSFGGIISTYMNAFERFLGVEIDYTKYSSIKKMSKKINDITLYFNYNTTFTSGSIVELNLPLNFDIYANEENNLVIKSLSSLEGIEVYVEENTLLYQNLAKTNLTLVTYAKDDLDKVLKDENNIIALDTVVADYLKKSSLKDYTSRYHDSLNVNYSLKSNGGEVFNTLLSKYLNYIDNNTLFNEGLLSASTTASKGTITHIIARYTLYIFGITLIVLLIIYRSSKRIRMQKKIKKEDKLKYIDQLTSLKNRNYLNENMSSWNKNTIYPQGVILIDLDKIQEINDTLGYEEGDKQIKGAANILVRTQLDNSDIIRTNGNEFFIYLVGYNEKQVTSYINKLNKEFTKLPYKYTACVSHSMIDSDLKNIEDALNECVEKIKEQKEKKLNEK